MSNATPDFSTHVRPDLAGILMSASCAVHCAAIPIVLSIAPVAGTVLAARWIHLSLLGLLVPIAGIAFWRGYRDHGRARAAVCGVAGLWILVCVAALERPNTCCLIDATACRHLTLSILGSATLTAAHLMNLRDGMNERRSRAQSESLAG